jgi:hypothetical protein
MDRLETTQPMSFQVFAIETATGKRRLVCSTFSAREAQLLRGAGSSDAVTIEVVGPDGPLTTAALDELVVADDSTFGT